MGKTLIHVTTLHPWVVYSRYYIVHFLLDDGSFGTINIKAPTRGGNLTDDQLHSYIGKIWEHFALKIVVYTVEEPKWSRGIVVKGPLLPILPGGKMKEKPKKV